MRVKTAELKNHLSRWLREVRERGVTIAVCDRDKPVALLSPLSEGKEGNHEWRRECETLRHRFEKVGLTCRPPPEPQSGLPETEPSALPDGRTGISTVEEMRKSRDW
jgi:antitoxin (DNA-binding transcriptional repressor) of toxin-antitoxin stability system